VKIVLIANTSWGHYNSRLRLGTALRDRGHEAVFLSPADAYSQLLIDSGFRWVHLPLRPRGRNILLEGGSIAFLVHLLRRERPHLVHNFTPKGVIYGSIAAKAAGIHGVINTITGLGYVFSEPSQRGLQEVVTHLYGLALKNTTVVFQNADDQRFFEVRRLVSAARAKLIRGSGVDTSRYVETPEVDGSPVVMLSSRFVEEKGIRDFVEASRILRSQDTDIRFVLVGRPEDDQPTAIKNDEITQWVSEGLIEWWGWHNNMEQIYPLAHIVCLPTYYMEGVPKSLLEAAACARPIVATDVPGCREIVREGENGFLVPPRNATELARAIAKLAADGKLRAQMGRIGRELALGTFSMEKIIPAYFDIYGIPY